MATTLPVTELVEVTGKTTETAVQGGTKECQICTLPRYPDHSKTHLSAILSSVKPEKPVFTDRFADQKRILKDNTLANN